jgi:hypothetical protein
MGAVEQLLERYDQTLAGDAWYGDPVWKILDGIDARCAAARPVNGVHTIWQLVKHMAFWEDVAARRLSGPVTPDLAGNFPEMPRLDEQGWQKSLQEFRGSHAKFREALSRVDPTRLDQNTPGGERTYRYEIVGVIEHHIYHIAQIALLKKAYVSAANAS